MTQMINMRYLTAVFVSVLLFGCSGAPEREKNPEDEPEKEVVAGDEQNIEISFEQGKFSSPKMIDLLYELKICSPTQKDLNNASEPACDPKFFHMQPFIENVPLEDAFLLVIRAGVHDWPLRRVLVYQREQGKLVLVNTFVANLIGMKKSSTGHNDLVLRFQDEYQNMFNCIYKWKEGRYQYSSVEAINDAKIKASLQDSMNIEIARVISDNKMSS